jgi:signal transduction histidine kinase
MKTINSLKLETVFNRLQYVGIALMGIMISGFFFQMTSLYSVRKENIKRFEISLVSVLFDSAEKKDIVMMKRIIKGFHDSHQDYQFCLKVDGVLIFGGFEDCQKKLTVFWHPLGQVKFEIYVVDTQLENMLLRYSLLFIFTIMIIFYLQKKILSYFLKIKLDVGNVHSGSAFYFENFKNLRKLLEEAAQQKESLIRSESMLEISKQVAHDIRSPLESLRCLTVELDQVGNETKQILNKSINRISEIAHNLLINHSEFNEETLTPINLKILLEEIAESFRPLGQVITHFEKISSYDQCFILGNENVLYRAISNLVMNAIESNSSNSSNYNVNQVSCSLRLNNNKLELMIKDFGGGIPPGNLAKIINGGFTTKATGSGRGVRYAVETIKKLGGDFNLSNHHEGGTQAFMSFTPLAAPEWFRSSFNIPQQFKEIVCIDDDHSFIEIYKKKLRHLNLNFSTFSDLSDPVLQEICRSPLVLEKFFFVDFQINKGINGIEFISQHNLFTQSLLVTSYYHDGYIQKKCLELNILLMPKQLFNSANISIERNDLRPIVLIDNDELVEISWRLKCQRLNREFLFFASADSFINHHTTIPQNALVYIDSNLGHAKKGEQWAEQIYHMGFKNITLTTGYDPRSITPNQWISKVIGKSPDF